MVCLVEVQGGELGGGGELDEVSSATSEVGSGARTRAGARLPDCQIARLPEGQINISRSLCD